MKNIFCVLAFVSLTTNAFTQATKAIGKITYEVAVGEQVKLIEMLFSTDKYLYFENNSLSNVFEIRASYPSIEDSLADVQRKEKLSKSLALQPPSIQVWYGSIEDNTVYETFVLDGTRLVTADTLDFVKWELKGDTIRINNVLCQMAVGTTPSGTRLTAWFAPSIPVSVAPYTLRGLPGLLLDVKYDNGKIRTHVLKLEYPLRSNQIIDFPGNEKVITKDESRRLIQQHSEKALKLIDFYKNKPQ